MTQTLLSVAIGDLRPDTTQPRKHFIGEEIQRLADSIAARGVLTPLRVMRAEDGKAYVIVTGESRYRAGKLLGLENLPCIVVEKADPADLLADRVVENKCRSDLSQIELAKAVMRLKRLRGCTATVLAKELGIHNCELSKLESLLSLPEEVQALVDSGDVGISLAYEIGKLKADPAAQRELAGAVAGGMSRKSVMEAVAAKLGGKPERPKDQRLSCHIDGVAVSLAADSPLKLDQVIAVLRRLIREASDAGKSGESVADLAARFKASNA